MTIDQLVRDAFDAATDSGWNVDPVPFPEMVALLHSEVSEALESYRDNEPISWIDAGGKPRGIGSEFADIAIRLGHYAAVLGVDLAAEIERKMAYNRTRPYRHGGKKC